MSHFAKKKKGEKRFLLGSKLSHFSELEELPPLAEEKEQKWTTERTIGKETWERRQQSGEYDTASISSSVVNRYRTKKRDQECAECKRIFFFWLF